MKQDKNMDLKERDSDEIDLIEIVLQLWRGKGLITLLTLVGLVVSVLLLVFLPAKWTSTATLTKPDHDQVARYAAAVRVLGGDTGGLENALINRFTLSFSALAETLDNQLEPEKLTIAPVEKGKSLPLKLSYQSTSAESAQAQLTAYIQQTNDNIVKELEAGLREDAQQKIAVLSSTLAIQEQIAQEKKDLRIAQIREALKFAQAAKIVQPQDRQGDNVNQETLFLLGTEALKTMVERESMRPLAYGGDYFQARQQLLSIKAINFDDVGLSTYRYVLKPSLPIRNDGPRKALILVLGVLLGGMVGCGAVLVRNALREYKASH